MNLHARAIGVLRASQVFGSLDECVLNDLAAHLTFRNVRGGERVMAQGSASDSMVFVVSGGLRVSRQNETGALSLYNEVRPGQSVGEIGLILQQSRTADVTAVRDSCLAVLSRASYEALLVLHPLALNRVFVQTIHNFMSQGAKAQASRYAQSFVVVPLHADAGASEVAARLVAALRQQGRVHHFPPPAEQELGAPTQPQSLDGDEQEDFEGRFDFLVYETLAQPSSWTRRAFRQADQVVFVAAAGASQALGAVEQRLALEPGFPMKRKHLVLLHPSQTSVPQDVASWRGLRDFERIYPLRRAHEGDFARLARFLTGTAIGVVLGGGGARGFAHLGVLRALQECGVPIDLVGGNSMGALIGAQYACGVALEDIRQCTQRFATGGERPTLPVISLVSGRRVERDLKRMFGETTMDQLWLPFFAAACNLSRGVTAVQDSGPVWRAVLASNSPAGLFPPVLLRGELLVDGAILENVPVQAMRERLGTALERRRGNGTVIAIDVDVRAGLMADPTQERLSVWRTLKSRFAAQAQPAPGIGDILYSASHVGGVYHRAQTMAKADHYLQPPVAEFALMSYRRSREIADVGYRYAMEQIKQWTHPKASPPQS